MKILVLGGNGFIGSNLVKKLAETNNEIYSFDYITPEIKQAKVSYIQGDFTKIDRHDELLQNIDIVYHLVSTTIPNSKKEDVEFDITSNLLSSVKLLNLCAENKVKKVIFSSSGGSIYGLEEKCHKESDAVKPIYPYAINKHAIECYLEFYRKFYNVDYNILRISNPYGRFHRNKKQGLINVIFDKIANNEEIDIFGDGEIIRDYIYIDDVIEAFIKCLNYSGIEKCFNVCSSKSYSINELLKEIFEITKINVKVNYLPRRSFDIPVSKLDNSLAKKYLNWEPKYSIQQGLKLCWENINTRNKNIE